jgi:hypothetical protein
MPVSAYCIGRSYSNSVKNSVSVPPTCWGTVAKKTAGGENKIATAGAKATHRNTVHRSGGKPLLPFAQAVAFAKGAKQCFCAPQLVGGLWQKKPPEAKIKLPLPAPRHRTEILLIGAEICPHQPIAWAIAF